MLEWRVHRVAVWWVVIGVWFKPEIGHLFGAFGTYFRNTTWWGFEHPLILNIWCSDFTRSFRETRRTNSGRVGVEIPRKSLFIQTWTTLLNTLPKGGVDYIEWFGWIRTFLNNRQSSSAFIATGLRKFLNLFAATVQLGYRTVLAGFLQFSGKFQQHYHFFMLFWVHEPVI